MPSDIPNFGGLIGARERIPVQVFLDKDPNVTQRRNLHDAIAEALRACDGGRVLDATRPARAEYGDSATRRRPLDNAELCAEACDL